MYAGCPIMYYIDGKGVFVMRITKKEFLAQVANDIDINGLIQDAMDRNTMNVDLDITTKIYETIRSHILDNVKSGAVVSLAGFGAFYLQKHKGHPVRFKKDNHSVPDYMVLKFSPSDVVNREIRQPSVCDERGGVAI